jgi:predicted short-subunit dehydrogenase-like oxidoreductase (DUF2520 family)
VRGSNDTGCTPIALRCGVDQRIRICVASTINIVGCGKVGRTLARLWARRGLFEIQDIANRTLPSAAAAAAFVGAGKAVESAAAMRPAEIWMIGTGDAAIAQACGQIVESGRLRSGDVVFHCSGALSSAVLAAAASRGASVASAHPVASFADPEGMLARFDGTFCCCEGDAPALKAVEAAFLGIGSRMLVIDAASKIIYHAGAVFASNYLVTVLDAALKAFVAAGLPQPAALELMQPLVRGSVDNVFALGPAQALTGPVARGDFDLVKTQCAELAARDPALGELYRTLALATARMAGSELDI